MACRKFTKDIIPNDDATGAPVTGLTGPLTSSIYVGEHEDFSVQLNYGAGAAGDAELQSSNDGVVFQTISSSVETLDPAGGSVMWNVTDAHYLYLRVVVPAAPVAVSIRFVGSGDFD